MRKEYDFSKACKSPYAEKSSQDTTWVDADDAPELTKELFKNAVQSQSTQPVSRLLAEVHESASELKELNLIDEQRMEKFDKLCNIKSAPFK